MDGTAEYLPWPEAVCDNSETCRDNFQTQGIAFQVSITLQCTLRGPPNPTFQQPIAQWLKDFYMAGGLLTNS